MTSQIGPVAPNGVFLFSATGGVYGSVGTRWLGSPASLRARAPAIVGMAATPDGGGYWLVGASGRVWSFGDAGRLQHVRHSAPVVGVTGA